MKKVYFLKNRRKKRILNKIYKLKEHASELSQSSKSALKNANDLNEYIHIRINQAKMGDVASSAYLSCHIESLFNKRTRYLNDYALLNQKFLNVTDEIQNLEMELEKLSS